MNHHRSHPARRLFTAAAFAILAAASLPPAVHAAPRHRAEDWSWGDFWSDGDTPRPEGSFEDGWSPRTSSATTPTGPQTSAILAHPNDSPYLEAGRAVALSGGNALVSSNINQYSVGSEVFLYHNVDTATGTVTQATALTTSDGMSGYAGINFGISVGIQGGLGIVGESYYSGDGYLGSVFVYRGLDTATSTVNQSATLVASDQNNSSSNGNLFGYASSLSGTTALVGAYTATVGSNANQGEAYVYRNLDTATGTVTENARLLASDGTQNAYFGYSASLSGTTGLVGAYRATVGSTAGQGAAYLYRNLDTATGTVYQNAKLVASDGALNSYFGYAVSESGNTGLVGAYRATVGSNATQGAAYLYRNLDTASGTVTQNAKLVASDGTTQNYFGYALALSGNTGLVGAYYAPVGSNAHQGAAYLYRNLDTATGTITENVKIVATGGAANDFFGTSVTIDGDNFLIGAVGVNSQQGRTYTGSLGSVSTLDLGNVSKTISGISFISQDNWVIGQNTSGNQVTLSAGDSATVTASGKAVYVGQNAGSNNNTLVLAGTVNANSFVIGATGNSGNTLQLGAGGTTGSLPVAATITNSGILAFDRSNAVVQGTDFNGAALTGTGGVTQLGTGATTLNAANTYTGATTVSAGTLQAGIASVANTSGAFGNNSAVTMGNVSGATLNLNNFNTQIGSLTGGGTTGGNVTLGSATLTVGGDNTSPAAYVGSISGTGGLTKIGTGTLTLAGSNTYSGATAVNAGTLAVTGALTATSGLTVASGAALTGTGTVAGAVTVTGGTFTPGQLGTGKLTLNNALTFSGATTAAFTLASTGNTQALVGGQLNLGTTATLTITLATGFTPAANTKFYLLDQTGVQAAVLGSFANAPTSGSQFTSNGVTYQINYLDHDPADTSNALLNDVSVTVVPAAVPEPSAWALLTVGAGVSGVMALRRRRAA